MLERPGRWPLEAITREVVPLLPDFSAELVPTIDSTNSELMRRARAGRTGATLLVAERQTAGRGRMGRTWVSQATPGAGGSDPHPAQAALTFSLALQLAPRDWSGLSLAVGVSAARSLHPALRIKWPNDLWLDGRKLAGILIEIASVGEHRVAVIGIGINIAPLAATGTPVAPAWLQELLPQADAPWALQRIVPDLVRAIVAFERQGLAPFLAEFKARDLLAGQIVVLSDGVTGTACGIDSAGALLVHTSAGMKSITSAEVSVRPLGEPGGSSGARAPG